MSIKRIIQVYVKNYQPLANEELNWYREQSSLRSTIVLAALAIDREGKRHKHQRRLSCRTLKQAQKILSAKRKSIERAKDFDELIHLIEKLVEPVTGIGDLYIYDTSLRIGAKLNLLPEKVYLHAGTRKGARAIGIPRCAKSVELNSFSVEFQELEPYEIEDVLCIFKDILKKEKDKNQ